MFDAYIFDLDGTLIDIKDISWFRKFQRRVYEEFGVFLPPDDDLYTALKLPNSESNHYLLGLGIQEPRDYWQRLEEEDYKVRERLLAEGFLKAYPDVAALDRLKGKIGMVSNTPESVARLELRRTGLIHHFDLLYTTQYNEEHSKPHPNGINMVLGKMGVSPDKALMVGDSELDVMAGQAAGVHTAHLIRSHFHNYDKTTPTFFINSLDELPALKPPKE
ncbi:MAG: HAD family hydrolase [Candidatus Thermoplasmatota archaeon]|jgi:pyrophosphatase PpaX|nr:HAD family hydrolase [Candidatus Thermoplasmatota archaeon]MDP7421352.1 HAD family hydrolase [bacterium]